MRSLTGAKRNFPLWWQLSGCAVLGDGFLSFLVAKLSGWARDEAWLILEPFTLNRVYTRTLSTILDYSISYVIIRIASYRLINHESLMFLFYPIILVFKPAPESRQTWQKVTQTWPEIRREDREIRDTKGCCRNALTWTFWYRNFRNTHQARITRTCHTTSEQVRSVWHYTDD